MLLKEFHNGGNNMAVTNLTQFKQDLMSVLEFSGKLMERGALIEEVDTLKHSEKIRLSERKECDKIIEYTGRDMSIDLITNVKGVCSSLRNLQIELTRILKPKENGIIWDPKKIVEEAQLMKLRAESWEEVNACHEILTKHGYRGMENLPRKIKILCTEYAGLKHKTDTPSSPKTDITLNELYDEAKLKGVERCPEFLKIYIGHATHSMKIVIEAAQKIGELQQKEYRCD